MQTGEFNNKRQDLFPVLFSVIGPESFTTVSESMNAVEGV